MPPVQGDACSSCGALAQRSFVTFEQLPLVRFQLAEGISDAEAARLLAEPPTRAAPPVRHRAFCEPGYSAGGTYGDNN